MSTPNSPATPPGDTGTAELSPATAAAATGGIDEMLQRTRLEAAACGRDLFAAYGVDLKLDPNLAAGDLAAGALREVASLCIAGFAGAHGSSFVILGTSARLLRRLNTAATDANDWMRELGNQLVGRIKNRLWSTGIDVNRLPLTIVEGRVPGLFQVRTQLPPFALTDGTDTAFIWIESESSLRAIEVAPANHETLPEGDLVLF